MLFKNGFRVKLQEQPLQTLIALLERPGEVVTRDELHERLWPDTHVDFERGLNKAINRLREALGDDADNPRFVETLPQRGYRFLAPVDIAASEAAPTPVVPSTQVKPSRRGLFTAAGCVVAAGAGTLLYHRMTSRPEPIQSIAVLPFVNLSGDATQEYFSDGITEELIGEIGRVTSARVISRTSVMRYRRAGQKSVREIAHELNVDAVVEGSVTKVDGKARINVRLVDARDDRHLWSHTYETQLADILTVQRDVALSVAREIRGSVRRYPAEQSANTRTLNPEAYSAFLKGNYFLHQGIPAVSKSVEWFTEATRLDPAYPEAQAGLAEALVYSAIFGLRSPEDAFSKARAAALVALAIDSSSAAAHTALADVKKGHEWDLAAAESEYRLALQSDTNHVLARVWYADCLSRMNRHDEALKIHEPLLSSDPVSPQTYGVRSMLLCRARRYDEGIQSSQQALELAPFFINARWWQGLSQAGNGDLRAALDSFAKAAAADPGPIFRALKGHVYGLSGERSKALGLVNELTAMAKIRFVSPMDFAIVYAGLGDADATFHWLAEARRTRAARMHEVAWLYFDRLRKDSRYTPLLTSVGLSA